MALTGTYDYNYNQPQSRPTDFGNGYTWDGTSYNPDGTRKLQYGANQSRNVLQSSSGDYWELMGLTSLNTGAEVNPELYRNQYGISSSAQRYMLAGGALMTYGFDPLLGSMFRGATVGATAGISALADQWGLIDRQNHYQNMRGYSDNSVLYDYNGNSNDQVAVTPQNWSGNGLPLSVTQGAGGWATTKPLPAGEEFTREELFKDYGLYWKGWSTEQVAGAATNLFGQMTDMTMAQSRDLADKLYAQANARANKTVEDFPAISQRALDATRIAGDALTRDMTAQFNTNLDTYMPGWRDKVVGASGALTEGSANFAKAFKEKILPELSYNVLQTRALLQNASRPMLAGEVPMSVSLAAMQQGSSAGRRGLTARDLGLNTRDMQGIGLAGINAASSLQSSVDKGVLGLIGAPGEFARSHGATVGQFTPPIVDTASLYGGIMQGLNAGAAMKPDQIFNLGMQSYEGQLNAGMNLFGQLKQLAVDQAATFNEANQNM